MNVPATNLLVTYSAYSFFAFYVQLWSVRFRGASQIFGFLLALLGLGSMIFGYGFLIYYGYKVSIVGAILLGVLGFILSLPFMFIEKRLNIKFVVGFVGLIAIPVLGYYMTRYV